MVDVFRPRIFRSKFSFNPLFFTAHQLQNLIILVFIQPEAMFGAAIKLQVEEPIIKSLEWRSTNRTFQLRLVADEIKGAFVRLVAESFIFQFIQFSRREPNSLTIRTGFDFHAAIILGLKINAALRTFHPGENT